MDWIIQKAEEFCEGVTDGTHDSPKAVEDGRYLITSKHLGEYEIDFSSAKMISEEDYKKVVARSKVRQWDILFSMIGTIGNTYLEKNETVEYACKNMGIFQMGGDQEKAFWLYYYLKSPQAYEYISSQLRGSTQQYVPLGGLREFPIPVPDVAIRRKIIEVLKTIDEKIDTNIKINRNLQEQLNTVYMDKFSKNYNGLLADICEYATERINVSELTISTYYSTENLLPNKAGATEATSLPSVEKTPACHKGNVLISNIRPYFKKIMFCHEDAGCSADVLCLVAKNPGLSTYVYSTLYTDLFFEYMVMGSKGTKMPRGDKQQIMRYPIHIPSEEEIAEFAPLAESIQEKIYKNQKESSCLEELRENIIPKLMSGELEVSDIDI